MRFQNVKCFKRRANVLLLPAETAYFINFIKIRVIFSKGGPRAFRKSKPCIKFTI